MSNPDQTVPAGLATANPAGPVVPTGPPVSFRAKARKPTKNPPKPAEAEPAAEAPSKRQRRAPTWLAKDCVVEEVPTSVATQIQETATNLPNKRKGGGATRFVNWRLLDRQHMICELEYQGTKYRGILDRTGTAPIAGVVLDEFTPSNNKQQAAPGGNTRDLCALCNQPLLNSVYPAEDELQKVVRVRISSNWVAHVHLTCGLWAPEVYEDHHGNLVNVSSAIRRARALRCTHCKDRGAAIGCHHRGCQRVYHLPCAHQGNCQLSDDLFTLYCPVHAGRKRW